MKDHFVVIDTDGGCDDAMAIWLAIKAHQDPNEPICVVGVVCVNGNTQLDNVTVNVARILRAVGEHGKIPIFRGSQSPIVEPFKHQIEPFHGDNGFGDVEDLEPIKPIISDENGIVALIRLAHLYKGCLSILALGPLTNLALAVRVDPEIKNCLRSIYGMGGNIEGEGNATISAEFNFAIDPEAAFIILSSYTCPIIIAPWEVCKKEAMPHEWRTQVLGKIVSSQTNLLNKIEKNILKKYTDVWIPCDQLAAAALVNPKVILESKSMHCTVERSGLYTRGLLILDHMGLHKKPDNVTLITKFDTAFHQKLLMWAMGGDKAWKC